MYKFTAENMINQDENICIVEHTTSENQYEHLHGFIEIVYIMAGAGEHVINQVVYPVERGDLLFINFNQSHAFQSREGMKIVNILVKPEFISGDLINSENASEILTLSSFENFKGKALKIIPKVGFRGKDLIAAEMLIENMIREFDTKAIGYKTALKGFLDVLLIWIFRQMRDTDDNQIIHQVHKMTPDILKYIEEKCFEKITLNELAEKSFYNPSYFSRIFKECYGKNLTDFIHEKRINEALRLMKETNLSIEDICYQIGYKEKKQFYKTFKQLTGETPNQMRLSFKNQTTDR